ncbi:Aldo-keto reductase YhdN [bioreactor metagenome]|uniref:Aldo-keto reductase YhdN n=1 Tax=bioreactor metagenome TaxID=1076179 RepID=A0A644Z364_9ZZZZ|nr:aldo/keto reductase [Erysipelotrichaceae bacterium]
MKYTHLQNANVDVSCLASGTWAIGGQNYGDVNREESIKAIRAMIDNGVNLIDTAPVYGNGYAEQLVGEALQNGYREKVLISTKFGLAGNYLKPYKKDASFANAMREVLSSLRNLKTDYIDFYFVHWPDDNTPIEETMNALNILKKKGAIRYIGLSNFNKEQVEEAMKYAKIDVIQPLFSMVDQKNVELMQWCNEQGIDSFTYGSMGAGILTGKYRSKPDFPSNDLRWHFYDYYNEPVFSKIQLLLNEMDKIAEKRGVPLSQIALNWSAKQNYVATCLVGASTTAHAIENCESFNWELTDEEKEMIDKKLSELEFGGKLLCW